MNAVTETPLAPAPTPAVRPFYWLLRRELWENRSLYIAPLIAAAVIFAGFLLNALHLPRGMQLLATLDPERQRNAVTGVYGGIGLLIAITSIVVTWFYALDALYSERRDRSILFWKSLPVSDTQTVLAKLFTAMIVAPAIALAIIVTLQLLLLILSSIVVLVGGADPTPLWSNLRLLQLTVVLIYTLIVIALWYAPIYAWLLLVSVWAKKSTFLWAALPPIALSIFESVAFESGYVSRLLAYRFRDGVMSAFNPEAIAARRAERLGIQTEVQVDLPQNVLAALDPLHFLANPWLWAGLLAAAGLTAVAIWMRRYREPI